MKNFRVLMVLLIFSADVMAQQSTVQLPTPQWRPVYHFTPEKNWQNDPNGLYYADGRYQLYYQHNPFGNSPGHLSWGHAESRDLLHWKHFPVAIPEVISNDTVTLIFSGSAVLDRYNTSGFGKSKTPPVVAIFTADQPRQKKESQYIAFSNDGGRTFTMYGKNPVIDLDKKDFRDPNVFWFEPDKSWVMAVAQPDEHQIQFYGSKDLKGWKLLSTFGPAGNSKGIWECPSIVPLPVDDKKNTFIYVMFISTYTNGVFGMQYFVGNFNGKTFKNINPVETVLTVDHGDCFYAAAPYHDAPGNRKTLIGWMQNIDGPTFPWRGQMSIPRDISLTNNGDGLRLRQFPAKQITGSLSKLEISNPVARKDMLKEDINLSAALAGSNNAYWLELDFNPNKKGRTGYYIARTNNGQKQIEIGYDAAKEQLYIDLTKAGQDWGAKHKILSAPLKVRNGLLKLTILFDRSSLEVFGNKGETVISTMIYPDKEALGVVAFSNEKVKLRNFRSYAMK